MKTGCNRDHQPMRNDRPAREHDHEGQQIERERNDPEQRHRRDVGRDMRRDRDQQAGRHGRERDPARASAPASAVRGFACRRQWPRRRRLAGDRHSSTPQPAISAISTTKPQRPQPGLVAELRSTARPARDRTAARGSCRHCWRHRENTDPSAAGWSVRANQACSSGLLAASAKNGSPIETANKPSSQNASP